MRVRYSLNYQIILSFLEDGLLNKEEMSFLKIVENRTFLC